MAFGDDAFVAEPAHGFEERPSVVECDTVALAAYDALMVLHMAVEAAGADADADTIGTAFVTAAAGHTGLTGPTELNDAGDRASASFDFWSVCRKGSDFTWVRTIGYTPSASGEASITRSGC